MICPHCGAENACGDLFCTSCGARLVTQAADEPEVADEPRDAQAAQAAPDAQASPRFEVPPAAEEQSVIDMAADKVGVAANRIYEAAGGTGGVYLRFGDFFSDVFKHHGLKEAEEVFICGTSTTTPDPRTVSARWPRPWLWSRMLVVLFLFCLLGYFTQGLREWPLGPANLLGVCMCSFVSISLLVFFFEANILRDVSFLKVVIWLFLAGVVTIFAAVPLQSMANLVAGLTFEVAGNRYYPLYSLVQAVGYTAVSAVMICACAMLQKKRVYVLNGMLLGAAVGAGISICCPESQYYDMLKIFETAGTYVAWGAIEGAAISLAAKGRKVGFDVLGDIRCLGFVGLCAVLQLIYRSPVPVVRDVDIPGFGTGQELLLAVVAWFVFMILLNRGLDEVNELTGATSA